MTAPDPFTPTPSGRATRQRINTLTGQRCIPPRWSAVIGPCTVGTTPRQNSPQRIAGAALEIRGGSTVVSEAERPGYSARAWLALVGASIGQMLRHSQKRNTEAATIHPARGGNRAKIAAEGHNRRAASIR